MRNFVTIDKELRTFYCEKMMELASDNEDVVILDSDLVASSGMSAFQKKFPERFFNCGIQEANMTGVAAGLSAGGMRPFIHSFGAFMSRRVLDQIFVSCAFANQNVCMVGSDPGLGALSNGGTHMSLEDIGVMRTIPGMTILDCCDHVVLEKVLDQIKNSSGNFYIRLIRKANLQFHDENELLSIGKASVISKGSDITLITSGSICLAEVIKAKEILERKNGLSVGIIDMFTIKPLDKQAVLDAAKHSGAILTVDNHNVMGGLGSAVAEVLAQNGGNTRFKILGVDDSFGQVGTLDYLLDVYGLSCKHIVAAVENILK